MDGAMSPAEDIRWMRMALTLAARSLGRVAPNPAVGAVLVREGLVLGRGATADGGRPHAEAMALEQARLRFGSEALAGAMAYVTLEPCAHHGHTAPCAEALIEAKITRVICPLEDPDPRVSGAGFKALRAAGIAVETGLMATEARHLNAGFLSCIVRRRPHLELKLAATLDGRIATRAGESRWITGAPARTRVHLMRAQSDAVLVGARTARADDPMLNVRGLGSRISQPVRVVADGRLSLPLTGRMVSSARDIPVWVLHRKIYEAELASRRREMLRDAGVETLEVKVGGDGTLDMANAMQKLAEGGITRVLCEGGGKMAATLLAEDLVDKIALFSSGKVIGGDGVPGVGPIGLERLEDAPGFELESVEPVGADMLSLWRRRIFG
jgi:diaminohydroxyphosphoribosylaminopyrimidine deaminase / 5-amino-6-(5-phosphoribosylamino)uracil reductase